MTSIKYKPSQKNALVTASRYCSIFKNGPNITDWVLSKPWKATDYRGPKTHVQCGTNDQARRRIALAVADIAMEIMLEGEDPTVREEAYNAMAYESQHNGGSAAMLLKIGLQAAERFKGEFKENAEGETELTKEYIKPRFEIVGDSIEGPGGRVVVLGRGLTREEVHQVATMHTPDAVADEQPDVNRMLALIYAGAIGPCRGIDLQYRSIGSSGWPHPWRATFIQPDTSGAAPTVVFDICPRDVLRRLMLARGYQFKG